MTLAEIGKRVLELYYGSASAAKPARPGKAIPFDIISLSSNSFYRHSVEFKGLKSALVPILAVGAMLSLASCGGGSSSSTPSTAPTTSGITKRALITDRYNGVTHIFNADIDGSKGDNMQTGSGSSTLALMPDKKHTLIVSSNGTSVVVVDNATEQVVTNYPVPDLISDIAVAADNKTAYAAVRNAPLSGQVAGLIEIIDITSTTGAPTGNIPVPAVRHLALNHTGSKMLAFSDNSNQVAVIDTATKAVTYVGGFDRPVFAVFSSDDATAYVLSCGAECGGTTARVSALNMTSNTIGATAVVSGATMALLDSGNLYVAGSPNGSGKLDVVSVATMTVSKSGVAITDGYHSQMALANSKLFIGATGCGNTASGCLSVYNTSSSNVINSAAGSGDVTGIQPITGRNVVYVIEGLELVIWDTSTDAPLPANKQVDIVGQAYDVKLID
jgi:hypothetical protein